MCTGDLIKQVKALPSRERQKLLSAILALEEDQPERLATNVKRVNWPDVEACRKLPNLVLLERYEEAFWAEHPLR